MNREAGFTLVEIMVTIMMIGVATASLTSIFISIRNIQLQATLFDTASRSAAREIESLRNNSYDSLTDGQVIDFSNSLPSVLPNKNGTANISTPTTGIRRVDATVTYKAQGKTRTVTLSSLIGEIGITQ